jgi:hypothetical protein
LEKLELIAQTLGVELRELFDFSHLVAPDTVTTHEIGALLDDVDDANMRELIFRITKAVKR